MVTTLREHNCSSFEVDAEDVHEGRACEGRAYRFLCGYASMHICVFASKRKREEAPYMYVYCMKSKNVR